MENTVALSDTDDNTCAVDTSTITSAENTQPEIKCPFDIESIISSVKEENLLNPIEVLRFIQQKVVAGRSLDLYSLQEVMEGETNYITVDRDRILESTFCEFQCIENFRLTFKVDFMGEESVDLGGPRKEWIRLMNHAIKEKYFDHGLRTLLSPEYYFVGIMIAVAILQNGQLPVFLGEEILGELLSSRNCSDLCIYQIQRGLETLGMLSVLMQLLMLVYLLRPGSQPQITVAKLLQILKPEFSEVGSNALKKEKEVYQLFVRYVYEIAASRRICEKVTLNISHILQFVTGAAEEPVLGFIHPPSLQFILPKQMTSPDVEKKASFLPFAHTCSIILKLPRGTWEYPLHSVDKLFQDYDEAFVESFFGKQ